MSCTRARPRDRRAVCTPACRICRPLAPLVIGAHVKEDPMYRASPPTPIPAAVPAEGCGRGPDHDRARRRSDRRRRAEAATQPAQRSDAPTDGRSALVDRRGAWASAEGGELLVGERAAWPTPSGRGCVRGLDVGHEADGVADVSQRHAADRGVGQAVAVGGALAAPRVRRLRAGGDGTRGGWG